VRRAAWYVFAVCAAVISPLAYAADIDVHVFWRKGCPHCARAIDFLDRAAAVESRLKLHYHELGEGRATLDAFGRTVDHFRLERPAVPMVIVGEQAFVGYQDDASTGRDIQRAISACVEAACPDVVTAFFSAPETAGVARRAAPSPLPETIRLPFVGEIRIAALSLPVLTVLLAAIDGFNPCAMWTLLFLIGLLMGIQSATRRWVLGFAFIASSAAVYYLFLVAWLNLLLFLGMVAWIRAGVAVLALAGGGYHLREFFHNPSMACSVTGAESKRRLLDRMRSAVFDQHFWIALAGIVTLAAAVNLVELICSAGIPAVYTQVLTMSALPPWQYHGYLLLYIAVFMFDDAVVFVAAMKALAVTGLTGAYARWSRLVGGMVLIAIGLLLLFRPEWLAFS
jgi:glutaredoxin